MLILSPINLRHASISTEAYDVALDLARRYEAEVVLVVVAPEMERNLNIRDSEAYWGRELNKFIEANSPGDVKLRPVVRKGATHRQIVKAAKELKADLIVMGSHNPRITDYLIGTTASHVASNAPCSVYIVRYGE